MADHQSFTNRLHVPLPKIGIRPAIDGRYGGVRESLEELTLSMAREAAKLITENLRHSNGSTVECVIPDHCIGGFPEAADVDELFAKNDVGATLTVTPCWCYGLETLDMHPTRPKAIWGFNGTDRPGAVYLAAALSAHAQKGIPAFGIYGHDVQDLGDSEIPKDVREKLLRFAKAAVAASTLKGNSYLAIGGVSMGIAGSAVNQDLFQEYFGMRVESVDMAEVAGRINNKIYDEGEFDTALAWVREHCLEGEDYNTHPRTREQKDADWETNIKMALIFRDLMVGNPKLAEKGFTEASRGHNALASGFQGQRNWTDYFPNGDFPEAILSSSFDWNGMRQPYIVATENDSLNGISMLLGHLLTGTAQLFSDVRTYWSPAALARVTADLADEDKTLPAAASNGFLHLINSGPSALDWTGEAGGTVKPFWEMSEAEADACLEATKWCASDLGYFPAGGWSTDFTTQGGIPCTMFRINLAKGLGPVLQIAEGETVSLPDKVHDILDQRTNPTWPTTWFAPRLTGVGAFESTYEVMKHWGANHGAIAPGHIGADLLSLAAMLRIPVEMHNVPKADVFRPASWDRFGSEDAEAADYRACAAYGPLFG